MNHVALDRAQTVEEHDQDATGGDAWGVRERQIEICKPQGGACDIEGAGAGVEELDERRLACCYREANLVETKAVSPGGLAGGLATGRGRQ